MGVPAYSLAKANSVSFQKLPDSTLGGRSRSWRSWIRAWRRVRESLMSRYVVKLVELCPVDVFGPVAMMR